MSGLSASGWDEDRWEQEYETLMEIARKNLDPKWERGEVVVIKTVKEKIYVARIPDLCNAAVREPLENQCIQKMLDAGDTEVFCCLATANGKHPEIPSWNVREGLLELSERNMETETFLWGGKDRIYVKRFHSLLPPNYQIKKGKSL